MNSVFKPNKTVGVLGGGQLGRMLYQASINLDVHLKFLDPDANAPCCKYDFKQGDLNNAEDVFEFGKDCDVVTIEIEHVSVDGLRKLEAAGVDVFPTPDLIEMIQDKGVQKDFYTTNNIPTSKYQLFDSELNIDWDIPFVQKLRKGGYDGKGVSVINGKEKLNNLLHGPTLVEELIAFEMEVSVIVARNSSGDVKTFPMVAMEFDPEANLVEFLYSPSGYSPQIENKGSLIAKSIAEKSQLVGVLAVEMFLTKEGDILVNEIAPRPHNSGHQTIEGNITSQYEQHLRSILNLPLGETDIIMPSVMLNLLGDKNSTGEVAYPGMDEVLKLKGVYPHIYGKSISKPFRKMGHVTVIDESLANAKEKALRVKKILKVIGK
jgi:5-(carboxyamino)imidazole ribonucleotide synthase